MVQRHLKVGSKPDQKEILRLIEDSVYVSGDDMRRDLATCRKVWAERVKDATNGRFRGVIQGYTSGGSSYTFDADRKAGPDGGEPIVSGDMRDTWVLCVVNSDGKVLHWEAFLPWADPDNLYSYADDLAEEVVLGRISLAGAKKSAQYWAKHEASQELEQMLESGGFARFEIPESLATSGKIAAMKE